MYANCPYNYSTSGYNDGKSSSTIASTWGAKVTAYAALSAKAKNYLSTEAGNSVAAITTMWTSYDYVYGHYASVRAVVGADFLGRDPAIVASFSIEGLNQVSNSPETIIIVVISATTLVAVGGFFLLRKKREN